MARIARVIAAGYPHHITQRGIRRQQTFFCDSARFVKKLEETLDRVLIKQKLGRKKRHEQK